MAVGVYRQKPQNTSEAVKFTINEFYRCQNLQKISQAGPRHLRALKHASFLSPRSNIAQTSLVCLVGLLG